MNNESFKEQKKKQVEDNYKAFKEILPTIIKDHKGKQALMRGGKIVGYFDSPKEAYMSGLEKYKDRLFSIQEVTDEPISLGVFSHVGNWG